MRTPVYIVDGCRSPIGKSHPEKGMFRSLRADELFVQVLQSLMDRLSLDPARVDDVYLGCVGQHLEQGKNLARLSWLLAGFPDTVPGMTLNRLCASSFSAVQVAADAIGCGRLHCVIAGGVEHMTHVPMTAALDYHPDLFRDARFLWNNMGLTAEFLAKERQISREEQDRFTQESNRRYFQALEAGFYKGEIVPIATPEGRQDRDQQPRLSSLEALAGLQPVFKEGGTVTAANSSGLGDGAAALVVADEEVVATQGWEPLAVIRHGVTVGLEPERMGLGPVPAIRKLEQDTGASLEEVDYFEINEAFAVQMLACLQDLELEGSRVNLHGGAVAMGHPLGMSGARIILTLARTLYQSTARYGVASMCVGHGQGVALLLERV